MPALRTLGLVVMAAFVISIGALGIITFQSFLRDRAAQDALLKVGNYCQEVVTTGGVREFEVDIPGGYTMRFSDNKILIDGRSYPQEGFQISFSENSPQLSYGKYTLSVEISDDRLVVTRIS